MMHMVPRLLCMTLLSVPCRFSAAALPLTDTMEVQGVAQRAPRQAAFAAQLMLQQATSRADKPAQLKALRILAATHSLLGNMFVIGEDIPHGERLAQELKNLMAMVEFQITRGDELQLAGQFAKADKRYSDALKLAKQAQMPQAVALGYAAIVEAAVDRGLKTNVVIYATKAYDLFESVGDLRGMAQMLAALGIHSADLARSIEYLERASDLCDPAVFRWEAHLIDYYLGATHYQNKDYAKARVYLNKALALAREMDVPSNAAYAEYYLGRVDLAENRFADALAHWDSAIAVFGRDKDLAAVFETNRFRADALSVLGRNAESAAALVQAQNAAETLTALEARAKPLVRSSRLQAAFNDIQASSQDAAARLDARRPLKSSAGISTSVAEARFDSRLRETENALLKEQRKGAELQRVSLLLALLGSIGLMCVAVFFLIRQIRLKRRFANLALRDELTGLRNRRSIMEFARVQFRMRTTLGTRLFISILDLDHFKRVNDQYGHDVGDAVLIGFANACQRHLRSNHVFGRFGGEEFMLIMPDTREDQVFDIFERLREVVGELHVAGLPLTHRLSFSMGTAEVKSDASSLEALIKLADIALYRAKEKGRDRCEIYDGVLQATYDINVQRARPAGHAPLAYDPSARPSVLKSVVSLISSDVPTVPADGGASRGKAAG